MDYEKRNMEDIIKKDLVLMGQNVKRMRNRKQMTQQDLAFYADTTITQICLFETGQLKGITYKTIRCISSALGCAVIDIMPQD